MRRISLQHNMHRATQGDSEGPQLFNMVPVEAALIAEMVPLCQPVTFSGELNHGVHYWRWARRQSANSALYRMFEFEFR